MSALGLAARFSRALLDGAIAGRTLIATFEIPRAAVETLPAEFAGQAFAWRDRDGFACAGVGVARRITVDGDARFAGARVAAETLFARAIAVGDDAPPPLLFGGFAFAPRFADPAWREFPDGELVLPRWSCLDGGRALLRFACAGERLLARDERRAAVDELHAVLDALARPLAQLDAPGAASVEESPFAEWRARVDGYRRRFGSGLDKVVAARAVELRAARPLDPLAAFRRLDGDGATRFLIRGATSALVGATPERLVSRRGERAWSEALAGSAATGGRFGKKELREHELVRRAVVDALAPFGEVDAAASPTVRAAPHVLHLWTPVAVRLRAPAHVLDLAAALHPTPAVAGAPAAAAVELLRASDPPRGWYAGAVGWLDARGDGDFAVALRCALVDGARARLYAGAGLVAQSDPAAEWRETALKLQPMLRALSSPSENRVEAAP